MREVWRKSSYSGATNGSCVEVAWRKSSHSGASGNGDCVEVVVGASKVGVRDSKNPDGPKLAIPAAQWQAFLARAQ